MKKMFTRPLARMTGMIQRLRNVMGVKGADRSHLRVALAYHEQGLLDAAFDYYRRCPASTPLQAGLYQLANDYEHRGWFGKAHTVFKHLEHLEPGNPDIVERAANSQQQLLKQLGATAAPNILPDTGDTVFGRFRLTSILGHGAMGIVYGATEIDSGREVAVKTFGFSASQDEDEMAEVSFRFAREYASARRLSHPNIVAVLDAGEVDGHAFLAMERLAGHDLSRYCHPDYLLPVETVINIACQCALALDYAHSHNVVHRDIKPSNIMYDPASGTVKITDFGVARILDASKTRTGTVLGTPDYMSPEQCEGQKADGRADLFSLGVVMFQLICGYLPFTGDNMAELMSAVVTKPPQNMIPGVDPAIVKVIHNAMTKKPQKRYQRGASMAEHLRTCQQRIGGGSVLSSEIATE